LSLAEKTERRYKRGRPRLKKEKLASLRRYFCGGMKKPWEKKRREVRTERIQRERGGGTPANRRRRRLSPRSSLEPGGRKKKRLKKEF